MSYRVIQWGAGFTGRFSLRYILSNPSVDLVGLKVFTDGKDGVDAGTIIDREPVGVLGTRDADALVSMEADCVVFMPRDALADPSVPGSPSRAWVDELLPILRSGKNVVSPIAPPIHLAELENGEEFLAELNAACEEGGTTVFFAGLDPGFTSDALAVTMAGGVGEITAIRTWEILDYSAYPEADVLASLGLGITPDELGSSGVDVIRRVWGTAVHLAVEALGAKVERLSIEPDIYLSPKTFTTPAGVEVREGTTGALRWALSGLVAGKPFYTVNHVTRMAPDMAPDWPNVGKLGGYRIEIDAFPPFVGEFEMGRRGGTGSSFDDAMTMTAARCVNAIETVVQAEPGYKTFLDLPPLTGKHAIDASVMSVAR
jgi:2,4-diaminopentanoate dehydrogenase